jgi:hypothetical protein
MLVSIFTTEKVRKFLFFKAFLIPKDKDGFSSLIYCCDETFAVFIF